MDILGFRFGLMGFISVYRESRQIQVPLFRIRILRDLGAYWQ